MQKIQEVVMSEYTKEAIILKKILDKAVEQAIPVEMFLEFRRESAREYLEQFSGKIKEEAGVKMGNFLQGKMSPANFISFLKKLNKKEIERGGHPKNYFDIFLEKIKKY